jgi:hypothetical protein
MDPGPLVDEQIAAGAELLRRFDHGYPVKVGFWLKAGEGPRRHLYIASDSFNQGGLREGYGEVVRLTDALCCPYLEASDVKLIGADDPLARAAVTLNERYPGRAQGTRLRETYFGGVPIEDIYIYPAPVPAAP